MASKKELIAALDRGEDRDFEFKSAKGGLPGIPTAKTQVE